MSRNSPSTPKKMETIAAALNPLPFKKEPISSSPEPIAK
jgi:hypothetical protein